ncbi:MAG: hypothetical protein HRT44_05470 [Bdellovibrionales bacterium]|nr:hypothetical protein [Bdellovibrionales bacterium]NQZ18692.1 hypothetical protein [Bdellovibrionales bacterium]
MANEKWIKEQNLSEETINKYSLRKAQLRHFYFPQLSKHRQIESYADYISEFGEECEPSADNNYCGGHYGAGVLNKALARLIERIGYKKLRMSLFNTALYRLNSESDFVDYGRQLYEECYEQSKSSEDLEKPSVSQCEQIITQFGNVGIDIQFYNTKTAD